MVILTHVLIPQLILEEKKKHHCQVQFNLLAVGRQLFCGSAAKIPQFHSHRW